VCAIDVLYLMRRCASNYEETIDGFLPKKIKF